METRRNDAREGEVVVRALGWRVRAYLGHTGRPARLRLWRSGTTRGVYAVPWRDRVVGVQWRRDSA